MSFSSTIFILVFTVFSLERCNCLIYCDNNCTTNGYYCVADDPGAFSVCSNGFRMGTMHCQTGLWWDVILNTCNWPSAILSNPQCPCTQPTTVTTTTTRAPRTTTTTTTTTVTTTLPPGISTTTTEVPTGGLKRVCYFTNWAVYRPGPASYWAGSVDPHMCTHIIVAFMNLNNGQISYLEDADRDTLATLTKMRDTQNPSLKILAAIGGWNAGSWPFITVVSSAATQDSFIAQSIQFLRDNNLDGIDVDWEYPTGYVAKFSQLMLSMRAAFEQEANQTGLNRLFLSTAVSAGQATIDYSYDVPTLSQAVDMLNLMSYDLNGPWNPTTGLNAGLHPQNGADPFNIEWCSSYWVQKGADPQKLMIGIPTYSRTFKLCNPGPTQTGIGSKACGTGNVGPYTQSAGFEAYYESCLKLQCSKGNWTSVWNVAGQAPFMYSGNQWISYENATSIAVKVNYVKSKGYGGVMVWAIDLDDFNDVCGSGVKAPLMSTLVAAATNQPLPAFNSVPSASVNPCDPTNAGGDGSPGQTPGTSVDLNLCDDHCAADGIYCVPDNIYAFYQCLNGVRYALQYCSTSLNYNYLIKGCDWPANYPGCDCNVAATTTTSAPITTTITSTTVEPTTTANATEEESNSTTSAEISSTTPMSTNVTETTTEAPETTNVTETATTEAPTTSNVTEETDITTSSVETETTETTPTSNVTESTTSDEQDASTSTLPATTPTDQTTAPTETTTTSNEPVTETEPEPTTTASAALRRVLKPFPVKHKKPLCHGC